MVSSVEGYTDYIKLYVEEQTDGSHTCFMAYAPWDWTMDKHTVDGIPVLTGAEILSRAEQIFSGYKDTLSAITKKLNPDSIYLINILKVRLLDFSLEHEPDKYPPVGDGGRIID